MHATLSPPSYLAHVRRGSPAPDRCKAPTSALLSGGSRCPRFCVTAPAYPGRRGRRPGGPYRTPGSRAPRPVPAAILAEPMPASSRDAVRAAYLDLGDDVPCAVRPRHRRDLPTAARRRGPFLTSSARSPLDAAALLVVAVDRPGGYLPVQTGSDQGAVAMRSCPGMGRAAVRGGVHRRPGHRRRPARCLRPALAVRSRRVRFGQPRHIVVDGAGVIVEHRLGDKRLASGRGPAGTSEVSGRRSRKSAVRSYAASATGGARPAL